MPFEDLPDRLSEVRQRIDQAVRRGGHGQEVRIIAVTKTHGPDAVEAAWNAGLQDVGENRVQEALGKMAAVSSPVRWHLIGHLQRNKVKSADGFHLIHSIDSIRLAETVDSHAVAAGRVQKALVQLNVVGEESKGGFGPAELPAAADRLRAMRGIDVCGVMTMAPLGASREILQRTFAGCRAARDELRRRGFEEARELSMGMSGDYEVAVEEGATMIRLGTLLFGERS
ncbi:MAG TPA: YggS family pyridoxal phosphate-dependent enzyme [Gemmatimonadaceae bacterium]|nr:YggS family pyridoxal phosphate-dependent enzyme [Gemmatimonadaceae bacterium]